MEHVRPYQQNLLTPFICNSAKASDSAITLKERKSPIETTVQAKDCRKRKRKPPETKAKAFKPRDACDGNQDQSNYANSFDTRYLQNDSDSKKVLTKDELRMLVKDMGPCHTDFKSACKNICNYIKNTHPKVKGAWPSYNTDDETNIFFVLVYDSAEDLEEDCDIKYDCIKRLKRQKSPEENRISKYIELNHLSLSDEESKRIGQCIAKHAVILMKHHKLLSIISISAVRSMNNGKQIQREPCMALYVHTKHYIPTDEKPFEKEYDGVSVDVREGTFTLHVNGNTSDENQDNLKIGCKIIGLAGNGTLGGFIEHPKYGLCGLTAAHVLFSKEDIIDTLAKESGPQEIHHFGAREVCRPANNKIGTVVKAVYNEGGGYETGMDAAIFTIEKQHPLSGQPADSQVQEDCFDSGQPFEPSWINVYHNAAIKFGYQTHKTEGKFDPFDNTISVKEVDGTLQDFNATFHRQIAVKSANFSANGDSGSLVFTRRSDRMLACVGLLLGGSSNGWTIITPIIPILRQFEVSSLKNFIPDTDRNEIRNLRRIVESGFNTMNKRFDELEKA